MKWIKGNSQTIIGIIILSLLFIFVMVVGAGVEDIPRLSCEQQWDRFFSTKLEITPYESAHNIPDCPLTIEYGGRIPKPLELCPWTHMSVPVGYTQDWLDKGWEPFAIYLDHITDGKIYRRMWLKKRICKEKP